MAVQSAAEGWAALCARRVERQSIDPRSTSASGLGRVRTRWRGDLIEWIIFSIVYFAAKIVMRDGFRSIWEKQFQSFPSLRGFHTARVRLGADRDPPTAGLPSAAKARVHGRHRRCVAEADILSGCSCSGLTNNDNLPPTPLIGQSQHSPLRPERELPCGSQGS